MAFPIWVIPLIQGISSSIGSVSKYLQSTRGVGAYPRDPYAGVVPAAKRALGQQLTGRPDAGTLRGISSGIKSEFASGLQAATRGIGANPASSIRQKFLAAQTAAMANARARAYQGAAEGKRSALLSLVGQRPSDLERLLRYNMRRGAVPGTGEAATGAIAEGGSDIAKLLMLTQLFQGQK